MGGNQSGPVNIVPLSNIKQVTATSGTATAPTVVVVNAPAATLPAEAPASQYSIKSFADGANQFLREVGPWIHSKKVQIGNNPVCNAWSEATNTLKNQVQAPLCNLYNNIPQKFTEAKFELISPYSYNQRFTTLNLLSALTAIITITTTSNINPVSRVLRTTRNATFMYLIGGLLFAPEIYNPLIKKW